MEFGEVSVKWLGHAGFLIEHKEKNIYIDPYQINRASPDADYVFITHSHYDHLSIEDLDKIVTDKTIIIAPKDSFAKLDDLPGELVMVGQDWEDEFSSCIVRTLPAYNVGKKFHQKDEGWVGYLFDFDGFTVYHSGDVDVIDEMKGLVCDLALLPVSGTYVMNADEAAKATKLLQCKKAIPMHWGSFIGERSDAEEFKKKAACDVIILEKE